MAGADDAEIRFLTVEATDGGDAVLAVYNDGTSPVLSHVTVVATADGQTAFGVSNDNGAEPVLTHVTVKATSSGTSAGAFGIRTLNGSSATIADGAVSVSSGVSLAVGIQTSVASARMTDVTVTAGSSGGGLVFGVSNDFGSTVEMLDVDVEAVATTSTAAYGVYNHQSTVRIRGGAISASGGSSDTYGVWNEVGGDPELIGVTVSATGGSTTTFGMYNLDAPATARGSTFHAADGTGAVIGVFASGSNAKPTYLLGFHRSEISGSSTAVTADGDYTVRAGGSQLDGGVAGAAAYTCVHAYDGSFAALTSSCA